MNWRRYGTREEAIKLNKWHDGEPIKRASYYRPSWDFNPYHHDREPVTRAPAPLSEMVPSKGRFYAGGAGAIIVCVGSIIVAITLTWSLLWFYNYGKDIYHAVLAASAIFMVGCILKGAGFVRFYTDYGVSMGAVAFLFSIISSITLFVTAHVGLALTSTRWGYYSQPNNLFVFWGGLALLGVTAILWGVACFHAKKFMRKPDLLLATGVIYIISGSLIASLLLTPVGFILLFVGEIMAAVVFLRYGMIDSVFSYIFLRKGRIDKSKCAEELGVTVEEVDHAIDVLTGEGKIEK